MIQLDDGIVGEDIEQQIEAIMNEFMENEWELDIHEEIKYEDPSPSPYPHEEYDDDDDNYDEYDGLGLDVILEDLNAGEEKRA
jgi:hypothetical protein